MRRSRRIPPPQRTPAEREAARAEREARRAARRGGAPPDPARERADRDALEGAEEGANTAAPPITWSATEDFDAVGLRPAAEGGPRSRDRRADAGERAERRGDGVTGGSGPGSRGGGAGEGESAGQQPPRGWADEPG